MKYLMTQNDLATILSEGASKVKAIYQEYQNCFNGSLMSETGLTDQYMIAVYKSTAQKEKIAKWQKSTNENVTGSDFECLFRTNSANELIAAHATVYFQAKVLQRTGSKKFADFLYKSGTTVLTHQYELLSNLVVNERAQNRPSTGYFIIYDYEGVQFANVEKVRAWINSNIMTHPQANQTTEVDWMIAATAALAKNSIDAADAVQV